MTRREFLGDSALLAAAQAPMRAQMAPKRDLLSSLWSSDKLAGAVHGGFHPFPAAGERAGWEGLPADARADLIAAGERQLQTPWAVLPATVALEFARNGNRSHYEALSFGRRGKLAALTLAECAEGKGRFVDEIVNGIWLTSEETFWGVPGAPRCAESPGGAARCYRTHRRPVRSRNRRSTGLDALPSGTSASPSVAARSRSDPG